MTRCSSPRDRQLSKARPKRQQGTPLLAPSRIGKNRRLIAAGFYMLFRRLWVLLQQTLGNLQLAAYARLHPEVHGRAKSTGLAHIDIRRGARLVFGKGVELRSTSVGYHGPLPSPVKLMADRPGAQITIGARTRLNGCCIHAWESIAVGADCLFASGVTVFDANGHELEPRPLSSRSNTKDTPRPVVIGNGVWLGMNVIVLPGSRIGDGSVIAAGSVVSGEIPPGVLAGGQPARVIRRLIDDGGEPSR